MDHHLFPCILQSFRLFTVPILPSPLLHHTTANLPFSLIKILRLAPAKNRKKWPKEELTWWHRNEGRKKLVLKRHLGMVASVATMMAVYNAGGVALAVVLGSSSPACPWECLDCLFTVKSKPRWETGGIRWHVTGGSFGDPPWRHLRPISLVVSPPESELRCLVWFVRSVVL